jgi:hypothetical protein
MGAAIGHFEKWAGSKTPRPDYRDEETVRRLRPCFRRADKTFLPPLVFIRARNPCVFLRWRLRGRYVRFMRTGLVWAKG